MIEEQRPSGELVESGPTYTIRTDDNAAGGLVIYCCLCNLTSYNPNDVKHRYCGNCKRFHELAQVRNAALG